MVAKKKFQFSLEEGHKTLTETGSINYLKFQKIADSIEATLQPQSHSYDEFGIEKDEEIQRLLLRRLSRFSIN